VTQEPPSGYPSPPAQPGFEREYPTQPPATAQRYPPGVAAATPFVAYFLLGFTVLVFIAQLASETLLGSDLPAILGMKVNDLIAQGEYWRLFTPMFLHGSILHVGFNMYALFIFGPGLERHFGHSRFLALYLLSGFAGNVASLMFSAAPSLGSSTSIFGLLGAQAVFLYRNRAMFGGSARRALNNIITIALINLVIGLSPGIDNWGHLGGLVGGTLFAWLGGPLLAWEGIQPFLNVVDRRETQAVWLAVALVGALFTALAVGAIYLRGGLP
jgi:rhomboid protease GluP